MKVAIIGGKLQGIEATYLAKLAGIYSIVIDINPEVPAKGFCDEFICGDIVKRHVKVINAMKSADFVLPANENEAVLKAVSEICKEEHLKLAFDPHAYAISSSKILSDEFMRDCGVPMPIYYPKCNGPYIAKPSGDSGSSGVVRLQNQEEVEQFLETADLDRKWIVEEYLDGPSYSIEVIGNGKDYRTYSVTQIHMDDVYDCCKVTCPCPITEKQEKEFSEIAIKMARKLELKGIMDVEVIEHNGELKVLEIDARIPSQTPIVVYYSSGMNLLSELADIVINNEFTTHKVDHCLSVSYEHYRATENGVVQEGEHMMANAKPLNIREDFLGSDVVISDFDKNNKPNLFRGIFINIGKDNTKLQVKRTDTIANLKNIPK